MRRVAVLATGLLIAALASPAAADSAPQWTAHTITGATWAANASSASSIACGDGGFCVELHGGQFPDQISVLKHGRVQSTISVPMPSGATDTAFAWLNKVVCTSATSCTAVGGYQSSRSALAQPLVETYDGVAWSPTVVPLAAEHAAFDYVACDVEHCLAVASSRFGQSLFQRTDGTWTQQAVSYPAPIDSGTESVGIPACAPTGSCYLSVEAVDETNAQPTAYVAYPSGSGYKAVRAPVPAGVDPAQAGIGPMSCAGPLDCAELVVYTTSSGGPGLYAVTLSAGTLSAAVIATPAAFDEATNEPASYVTCPAVGRCTAAVGFRNASTSNVLLARLQNGAWHTRTAPRPMVARSFRNPTGVACASVDVCTVVGTTLTSDFSRRSAVVWTYSGSAWSVTAPQRAGGLAYTNSSLDDAACSGQVCYASGGAQVSATADKPLVALSARLPAS